MNIQNVNILSIVKTILLVYFIVAITVTHAQDNNPMQIMDTVTVGSPEEEIDSSTSEEENGNGPVTSQKKEGELFMRKDFFNSKHEVFKVRSVPDSIIKRMQDDDAFWYASHDFRKKSQPPRQSFIERLLNKSWFRTLIWLLIIGGFISVVTWYLMSSNVSIFSRRPGQINQIDSEETSENIFEIDFEKEIKKAISESQFRLAIRLMYLDVLKNLSLKDLITYKQGKTNFDYLLQMNASSYYNDFFRLTRDYEYTWYGKFDISSETFHIIKKDFENFSNRI